VDHVPHSLLIRKSGGAQNRSRISGSVARNSDHQTTEAIKHQPSILEVKVKVWQCIIPEGRILWTFVLFFFGKGVET
jgi:hypothetical protein